MSIIDIDFHTHTKDKTNEHYILLTVVEKFLKATCQSPVSWIGKDQNVFLSTPTLAQQIMEVSQEASLHHEHLLTEEQRVMIYCPVSCVSFNLLLCFDHIFICPYERKIKIEIESHRERRKESDVELEIFLLLLIKKKYMFFYR